MNPTRSSDEWNQVLRRQVAVAHLGRVGLQGNGVDAVIDDAMCLVADALELPHVALFELFEDRGMLEGRAAVYEGTSVSRDGVALIHLPTGRGSMPGYALLEGETVVAFDLLADARFVAMAPTLGVAARAAIAAPIEWGDRRWGVLAAYDGDVRRWTTDEVTFVQSVANTLGLAIQRQAVEEELRAATVRLDLSLAAGGLGAWSWVQAPQRVDLDRAALAMHGVAAEEFGATPDAYAALVHPDDRDRLLAAVDDVLRGGRDWDETYRVVRPADGATRWIHASGQVLHEPGRPIRLLGVCADVSDHVADEQRHEATLVAEKAARRRAEQAGARLATLSEASALFSQSLEPDVILAAVAEFCVPLLSDVCRVETLDPDGRLVTRVVRGIDGERVAAFEALEACCPGLVGSGDLQAFGSKGGGVAARAGGPARAAAPDFSPVVLADLGGDDYAAATTDPDQLRALQRLAPRSVVIAPLVARNTVLGRLTLIEADQSRRQRADHVAMIEELASRAALALDNGRLYESRARMVDSLQAVLVPRALPEPDELRFAARYRVGEPHHDVGGDFYDVFEIADDQWGVMVGDVCGRGPDAAALTGLVRHSIRAAVVRDSRPLQVLSQTNDAVIDQIDEFRFCTATYMRVERTDQGAHVAVSSAGHPRPVVVRAGGGAELLDCSGVLLGVVRAPTLVEVELDLCPGDAVVLYTDGVTEARGNDGLFGDDRLVAVLRSVAGRTAEEIADALDDAVRAHTSGGDDDLAIVVVQAAPR